MVPGVPAIPNPLGSSIDGITLIEVWQVPSDQNGQAGRAGNSRSPFSARTHDREDDDDA